MRNTIIFGRNKMMMMMMMTMIMIIIKGRGFDEVIKFFLNWPNPFSRTMALGSTQPLTKMSTSNFRGRRPAHKTDNLTAIFELIV
jgi:hypothetical protein